MAPTQFRLAACLCAGSLAVDLPAIPELPDEYIMVGLLRMPYLKLELPVTAAISKSVQRIEYREGLEVDYKTPDVDYKYIFSGNKLLEPPKRRCLFTAKNASAGPTEIRGQILSEAHFLPNLKGFVYGGNAQAGGVQCQRFDFHHHHGVSGSMDDVTSFYWDPVLKKPRRWHIHGRNPVFGAHTDEYIVDYLDFQSGRPEAKELMLPEVCKTSPIKSYITIAAAGFLQAAHGRSISSVGSDDAQVRRNSEVVAAANAAHAGVAKFSLNQYASMDHAEFMRMRGGRPKFSVPREKRRRPEHKALVREHRPTLLLEELPASFDWRQKRPGAIGAVKDQAWCGSCWTYGVMGPAESMTAILSGEAVVTLPEQFAVDCTWPDFNASEGKFLETPSTNVGCDGGYSDQGIFTIVTRFGGVIPTQEAYGRAIGIDGYCKDIRRMDIGARVTGWVDVPMNDSRLLMDALVTQGPIAVGISVPPEMTYYDSGIINTTNGACNMDDIDHEVVLVGYGTEHGLDYWLLRNSWSTYWGDKGYFRIARGALDCCVTMEAGYPIVAANFRNDDGPVVVAFV